MRFGPIALALALLASALSVVPAAAAPRQSSGLILTLAARTCPAYTDITANRARNNIMESLQDLGVDTPYKGGEAIDPAVEQRVQPRCTPLPDWTFTLGDGYRTRAVTGPWGALSIVTNPNDAVTTQASVPLLDPQGNDTGHRLAGAATIALNPKQEALAARHALWVQGGTVSDPILNGPFPGPRFGFGALRCAIDNLNGDNVEFVGYPAGVTHVFCFAYYVEPPPTSGTIVIRKQTTGAPRVNETFPFAGSVSYNAGGRFNLAVKNGQPAEETFFRGASAAAGHPWTVRELGVEDWKLTDLTCTSRDKTSAIDTSQAGGAEASISLGAGDLVTCTYSDDYQPPPQGLAIRKVTEGGVGRFTYAVTPAGGGPAAVAVVRTTEEDVAAAADPSPLNLASGRYEIREDAPDPTPRGHWELRAVECDGQPQSVKQPIEVTVPAREALTCTFHNTFVPRGSITISKITRGAVGTSSFVVSSEDGGGEDLFLKATTTKQGEPVRARGDDTDSLPLGRYEILDLPPPPGEGVWSLSRVSCDGHVVPFSQGRIELALSAANPDRHCTFLNSFDPTPPPHPKRPTPNTPDANLVLSKKASSGSVRLGGAITYRIGIRNMGKGEAADVLLSDGPRGAATLLSATTADGTCGDRLPLQCHLGTLAPGSRATVTVRMRPWNPGSFVNYAAASTSSFEANPLNAQGVATVQVTAAPPAPPINGLG